MSSFPDLNIQIQILIVDDTPDNIRFLSEILTKQGYQVKGVLNGSMALRVARSTSPDLILLDIKLPDIDGYEVCQQLKANKQTRDIPIMFLSSLDDVFDKVKAFKVGGVDYITKPFHIEEILVRIQNQLNVCLAKKEIHQLNLELEKRVQQRTAQLAKINQELQQEIIERRKAAQLLQESEERLESILNSLEDVVWSASIDTCNLLYLNPGAQQIYGRASEEFFQDANLRWQIVHPEDRQQVQKFSLMSIEDSSFNLEYRIIRPNGEIRWLSERSHVVHDSQGKPIRLDGIAHDITERKLAEEKLIHDAFHDTLTGLPNRVFVQERIELALKQAKRSQDYFFVVFFIDLDRFKIVNDSLGHLVGDQLLIAIAQLLKECLRERDIVARLGGDEFIILLENLQDIADAIEVTERIQRKLALPIELNDHTLFSSASIGIVVSCDRYENASEILRDADLAMYRAKALGKARYAVFDPEMYEQNVKILELERDLRFALERQEFLVYYQPIVFLNTGELFGFEALIRWQHPEKGLVPPADFIPVAEDTGLILQIGEWVLREACSQLRTWQLKFSGAESWRINVNLASHQIKQADFLDKLDVILMETGLQGNCLRLELTETMLMDYGKETLDVLSQIKARKIQLCIDDFGQGYSSLSYLHRFPVNTIKIDRSFVSLMASDDENFEIVRTITTLAHTLGMSVVAEGVETQQQVDQLRSLRCEFAQGYFFAQPLQVEQVESRILTSSQFMLDHSQCAIEYRS